MTSSSNQVHEDGRRRSQDFADRFAEVAEDLGLPRTVGRVMGWLLVCDPPLQSSRDIEDGLEISRASVSIATRFLRGAGLVTRRTPAKSRGPRYELDPSVFIRLADAQRYRAFRQMLEECLELKPDDASLQEAHAFYAFMEREIDRLIAAYHADRAATAPARGLAHSTPPPPKE